MLGPSVLAWPPFTLLVPAFVTFRSDTFMVFVFSVFLPLAAITRPPCTTTRYRLRPRDVNEMRLRSGMKSTTLRIRRSRYLGKESAPKTRSAKRVVRLTAENVPVLTPLIQLRAQPDDNLFKSLHGEPIDASNFADLFRNAQHALGLRPRKFYATKHTYVSNALTPA
jgi:hypothetical protein